MELNDRGQGYGGGNGAKEKREGIEEHEVRSLNRCFHNRVHTSPMSWIKRMNPLCLLLSPDAFFVLSHSFVVFLFAVISFHSLFVPVMVLYRGHTKQMTELTCNHLFRVARISFF